MLTLTNPLNHCVEELRQKFEPNIEAFVLKFDLGFITILFHPDTFKLVAIFPGEDEADEMEILNFMMEYRSELGRVNISFQLRFKDCDGFNKVNILKFEDVEIKMYQIRAID